ncbi:MAG: histone deacetylase [Chloroflexi bacterium RBG_16_60_22]|nr:MAG: histone deacetylase [Chloroflexi bacterium RBG_16_60_22]
MFRIRRVYDDITPANQDAIAQVQEILRTQFPLLPRRDIRKLPEQLRNPLKYRFRAIIFIAEGVRGHVDGFALLFHEPTLKFGYLDYISAAETKTGGGIGGALYERVREEALDLETIGLFFECLPDDPTLSRIPETRKQNARRLRFYERYGARPIINTAYETPINPGGDNPPFLVYDDLARDIELPRDTLKEIVRAILERKYKGIAPQEYVEMVVASIKDDPVRRRAPRYVKKPPLRIKRTVAADKRIRLVINDRHWIHHVEERGYVESPVRIDVILEELAKTNLFQKVPPRHYSEKHIKAVHDHRFVDYLRKVCAGLSEDTAIYPYVFPVRNRTRPPRDLPIRAGYYCIDTFTPLTGNAYLAARRAVDCALTAAKQLLEGYRLAYALVRPPGHHAEPSTFGGFCYFNSTSVAANLLSSWGKVAILDIDYHHGNGHQEIFYERADVLTISIHGHPRYTYPYFSGFAGEKGKGEGRGFNVNIPLPENIGGDFYRGILKDALKRVKRFRPRFLVVALGLDTAREDPTGSWTLEAADFEAMGEMIGALRYPTLVVQEGGYDTRVLGTNARSFLAGLWTGAFAP